MRATSLPCCPSHKAFLDTPTWSKESLILLGRLKSAIKMKKKPTFTRRHPSLWRVSANLPKRNTSNRAGCILRSRAALSHRLKASRAPSSTCKPKWRSIPSSGGPFRAKSLWSTTIMSRLLSSMYLTLEPQTTLSSKRLTARKSAATQTISKSRRSKRISRLCQSSTKATKSLSSHRFC